MIKKRKIDGIRGGERKIQVIKKPNLSLRRTLGHDATDHRKNKKTFLRGRKEKKLERKEGDNSGSYIKACTLPSIQERIRKSSEKKKGKRRD